MLKSALALLVSVQMLASPLSVSRLESILDTAVSRMNAISAGGGYRLWREGTGVVAVAGQTQVRMDFGPLPDHGYILVDGKRLPVDDFSDYRKVRALFLSRGSLLSQIFGVVVPSAYAHVEPFTIALSVFSFLVAFLMAADGFIPLPKASLRLPTLNKRGVGEKWTREEKKQRAIMGGLDRDALIIFNQMLQSEEYRELLPPEAAKAAQWEISKRGLNGQGVLEDGCTSKVRREIIGTVTVPPTPIKRIL